MHARAFEEEEIDEGESQKEKRTSFTVHFYTPALHNIGAIINRNTFKAINTL